MHISPSQITMYMRCPLQHYYRYVRGIKVRPSGNMTLGSTMHNTFKENYDQKVMSHKDLPIPHLKEFFANDFEVRSVETEFNKDEKPGKLKDAGIEMTRVYHTVVSPVVQPLLVEHKWNLQIDGMSQTLMVILDLVDINNRIKDHKITSRTPNQTIVRDSIQLTIYSLAYRLATDKTETSVGLDFIVRNSKNEIHINRLEDTRNIKQIDRAIKVIKEVGSAIDKQIYYPCNPENWNCSEKWCGFWHLCHKEW